MAGLFDKAKEFADTDKGESVTDSILEKATHVADEKTGGTHGAQIEQGREQADKRIGRE
jgi:hypothetical protein